MNKLFDENLSKVLDEFGAGKSVPGSGCGSALNAILNSEMILTHVKLSLKIERESISENWKSKFELYESKIEKYISELKALFDYDYITFKKYREISRRLEKNLNSSYSNKWKQEKDNLLVDATKNMLDIGELCRDIVRLAFPVFKYGYSQSIGESGLPLNTFIGILSGCILISFDNLKGMHLNKTEVRNVFKRLNLLHADQKNLAVEVSQMMSKRNNDAILSIKINTIINSIKKPNNLKSFEIEELTRRLLNTVYKYGKHLLPTNSEHECLSPEIILNALNYKIIRQESLGVLNNGKSLFEVAGLVDYKKNLIGISQKYDQRIQRFTLAHELGHIALGHQLVSDNQIHRDLPLNKKLGKQRFSLTERQADLFASRLLLPRRLVTREFERRFETSPFTINEFTAFAFNKNSTVEFRKQYKTNYELCKLLASTEYYNGKSFISLSKLFGVSVSAMAISIEQYQLTKF